MINYDKTIESALCPGLVIGFEGTSCSNSVSVVLATKNGWDDGQDWMLREDGVIVNAKCDTKAIDISGGTWGTDIILWSIHGGGNQQWELLPTEAATSTNAPSKKPTDAPVTQSPIRRQVPVRRQLHWHQVKVHPNLPVYHLQRAPRPCHLRHQVLPTQALAPPTLLRID
jgi:hypothetical protein